MSVSEPTWSYARHSGHEQNDVELPSCYSAPKSVDAWRHRRMLSTLSPLLETCPDATWLTVGDGAYGSDAHYLQSRGASATASSLTDTRLGIAHQRGYISSYRAENAENLSLADDSHDFVLCKESYHHFPRPPVAFYEMLRVARRAVVLIEPIDGKARLLDLAKKLAKKLLRGDAEFQFEPSGNFIFRVSVREIEKMLTALNGPCLAYKTYNDFYYAPAAAGNYEELSAGRIITTAGLLAQDLLCRAALLNFGLATIVVFKQPVDDRTAHALRAGGYTLRTMPRNPYVQPR